MSLINHRRSLANGAAIAFAALTIVGCGSEAVLDESTTTTEEAQTTTSVGDDSTVDETPVDNAASTLAGVEAAQWTDNVTIEIGEDSFRFVSDGLPGHEIPDEFLVPTTGSFSPPVTEEEVNIVASEIAVVETPLDVEIPLNPVYSETATDTNLGIIGVTISGAQLFNDYEDTDRSFVAVDDNFSIDGVFFVDGCNGHPLALQADGTGSGNYHYHGVPYCITDAIDADGEHSTILGFLVDGFPFYGPQDADGITITSDDLDACSGHVGPTPEFPEGIYHYHVTEDRSPYTVDCYHGVVEVRDAGGTGAPGEGGAPDFSDAAGLLDVTEAELLAALGQPPFDLDVAAAELGVSAADLEAALPAPPG